MPFWRADETCPECYHVLIRLADYDPRKDSVGIETGGWAPSRVGMRGRAVIALFDMVGVITDHVGGHAKHKQLSRILRAYPNSLYCTGCGYVDRRA